MINFLLMFGLCCAFGMILFDETNAKWQPLGVKMSLATSTFSGLLVALFSRIPVAIAGPDLNPIVFLGTFVATMAPEIARDLSLSYPGERTCGRRLEVDDLVGLAGAAESLSSRLLGGGGGSSCSAESDNFCKVGSELYSEEACNLYNQQLVTTTIFAVAVSSAVFGLVLFLFGRFNLTRYMSYVPTSISEAFLSCVGYKVFAYALKFCKYDPRQFLPASFVGVLLYFLKANHVGNPAVVIPSLLLIPLAIFHVCVACGLLYDDLEHAREQNVMFPYMDNIGFWTLWTEGLFDGSEWKFQYINFNAWSKTVPDLVIMIIVVLIDCLLKVKNTENKLPVVPQADYETQLFAACNALMFACGSPCGYMQLKFNVINFGILGNARDRRGGVIYAVMCGICFFWTISAFNFLPRFFLGMLLFFAGAGFVAENLWGSRKFLSLYEWMEILGILMVFIISGQLLYAVGAGLLFTVVSFITRYGKIPVLTRKPIPGGDVVSYARREGSLRLGIRHIADSWFFVIPVKGYLFFATAKRVAKLVGRRLHAQDKFDIVIDNSLGELGVELRNGSDDKSLVITSIQFGAVHEWNCSNPQMAVEPGDCIIDVVRVSEKSHFAGVGRSVSRTLSRQGTYSVGAPALRDILSRPGVFKIKIFRQNKPTYRRPRYVIMECSRLDGMDSSAASIFRKTVVEAEQSGTIFLWTKLGKSLLDDFQVRGLIRDPERTCFGELEHAVFHIEERIIRYRQMILNKWLCVHPALAARHHQLRLDGSFEPFQQVFQTDAERRGCPWMYCSRLPIRRFKTVLWGPGSEDVRLFLVHSGAVGIYHELAEESWGSVARNGDRAEDYEPEDAHTEPLPSSVYQHGWFLNREFVLHMPTRHYAIAVEDGEVLAWSHEQWDRMSRQRPLMTAAIVRAIMRQKVDEEDSLRAAGENLCQDRRSSKQSDIVRAPSSQWTSEATEGCATAAIAEWSTATTAGPLAMKARQLLQGLQNARALEALGLWSAPGQEEDDEGRKDEGEWECAGPVAKLPNSVFEDLSRAFYMYCEETDGGPTLKVARIRHALMFAGIFSVELDLTHAKALTHLEFIALGHEASISRLTRRQKRRVLELFAQYDEDESGTLDRHELPQIFKNEFAIPATEIDSLAREVDMPSYHNMQGSDGQVDEEGFFWIVARLVRMHEHDFMLLRTLRDLHGSSDVTVHDEMTLDRFKEKSEFETSDAEWQEMFWVMDMSVSASHLDPRLGFGAILAMLIPQEYEGESLPPFGHRPLAWEQHASPRRYVHSRGGMYAEIRKLVVDLREFSMEEFNQRVPRRRGWHAHKAYSAVEENIEVSEALDDADWRDKLRALMEDPNSSREARWFAIFLGVVIVCSILNTLGSSLSNRGMTVDWSSPFWILDVVFTSIFTLEFVTRVIASRSLSGGGLAMFILTPRNLIDFFAIWPTYMELALSSADLSHIGLLRVVRLLRLTQLARMGRAWNWTLAGPMATVLIVIWGIYLKETAGKAAENC